MSNSFGFFNLKSLQLHDFRKFRDFSIQFNVAQRSVFHNQQKMDVGPLTVLVAKNGMGKTSVLDAVRVLFGRYTCQFKFPSYVHFQKSDIRRVAGKHASNSVLAAFASVDGEILLHGVRQPANRILLSKKNSQTTTKGVSNINDFAICLVKARQEQSDTEWPLLAFYGTGRLWSEHRNRYNRKGQLFPPDFGYENCLGENHNFKAVDTWLYDALFAKFSARVQNLPDPTDVLDKLTAVECALDSVLRSEGYEHGLLLRPTTREVAVKQLDGNIPIDIPIGQLSDGVRAAFGLVADIAFRCAVLNPQFGSEAPQKTHGIVLIDEVDLHLHPAWQQRILNTLQLAFPKLQFIVTTHSPQVISSVPKECVRIISPGTSEAIALTLQTQGVESQDILAEVFGTSGAPETDEWVVKLNDYATKVAQGVAEDGDPMYQELLGHYGTSYQPLLRIELQRRFSTRKGGENA